MKFNPDSARVAWAENRFGLDYHAQAQALGPPIVPIVDIHSHINGGEAAEIYGEVAEWFGVRRVYTQSRLADGPAVRKALGDRVRFMAFPDWGTGERHTVHRDAYLEVIRRWHGDFGARCMKFWGGPMLWDMAAENGQDPHDVVPFDAPWRVRQAELACELGMMFMVHVADPDTWFQTKWADASKYGSKESQYRGLEVMVARYNDRPWIAAHMGGWPENLSFLDGLLTRHSNLYLDTSATKWMVRALSAHEPSVTRAFFERWRGRVLFGSDIVTTNDHLQDVQTDHPRGRQANNAEQARELYASRYLALRTLFETSYIGESPIADPDMMMLEPEVHTPMSASMLRGMALDGDVLRSLYAHSAEGVVEKWYESH